MVCVSVITGPWRSSEVWIDRLAPDSKSRAGRCRCVHMHRQERLRRGVCLRQITGYTWRYVRAHSFIDTDTAFRKQGQRWTSWKNTHSQTLFTCFTHTLTPRGICYCSELTQETCLHLSIYTMFTLLGGIKTDTNESRVDGVAQLKEYDDKCNWYLRSWSLFSDFGI